MNRVYPSEVNEVGNGIIAILVEDGFFSGEYFSATTYATRYIKDVLLEKFLGGQALDLGGDEEMSHHVDMMITGSIIYQLKEQGYVQSYEDEDTPEVFFTTEKGRRLLEESADEEDK
jgi:hypothetical protein